MARAMRMHASVIRKVAWSHGGHVLEQEGGTFTLGFHDGFDAVCFALQVRCGTGHVDVDGLRCVGWQAVCRVVGHCARV